MAIEFGINERGETTCFDPEIPGVVGVGRSTAGAERDFRRVERRTWHTRRVAKIQETVDRLFEPGGELPSRAELMELQALLDEFVGRARQPENEEYTHE